MKKGCALSFGCSGIIVIMLFAVVVINFYQTLILVLMGLVKQAVIILLMLIPLTNQSLNSDFKWKFTSTSLGRKNYKISFQILEFEVKKALPI
ncbi:MAG: hypothetical protein IPH97_01740 [Ignavibacteriales bacterium]|nr:hypothetical protein [Ignavibacteriales bacterium]